MDRCKKKFEKVFNSEFNNFDSDAKYKYADVQFHDMALINRKVIDTITGKRNRISELVTTEQMQKNNKNERKSKRNSKELAPVLKYCKLKLEHA